MNEEDIVSHGISVIAYIQSQILLTLAFSDLFSAGRLINYIMQKCKLRKYYEIFVGTEKYAINFSS